MARNLKLAHSGYRYQDIASAYMLIRALVQNYDEVTVDKKQVIDDKLDDLEVRINGSRIRRQFKSSRNPERRLSLNDFLGSRSSLRFDLLVLTHVRDARLPDEHRLCATWKLPAEGDELWRVIEQVSNVDPTFSGSRPACFRLNVNEIWPEGREPQWEPLIPFSQEGRELSRDDVVDFCRKFIIEIELPIASTNLDEPGEFERFLIDLLVTKVGIGKYPNQGRNPVDVAALAISLATTARTEEQTLLPQDVEQRLDIRTDYGRIAQSFPLDKSVFHNRPDFRHDLIQRVLQGGVHLVTAPPGGGKSWELTCIDEELQKEGAVVAKHYCYLEPGDELVERRVMTDTFFGNLLAEIYDVAPELREHATHTYSADLNALADLLKHASRVLSGQLVLIVDGLDHIARVKASSSSLSDDETSIMEMLATIEIPEGVALILGSQPGDHLEVLREAKRDQLVEHSLPRWCQDDIIELANLHGITSAFNVAQVEQEDADTALSILAYRSDGNPLYARYLSCGLVAGLLDGSIHTPVDWLEGSPQLEGDIALYYSHLYESASKEAKAFADLLGVLEFSVSKTELCQIIPFLSEWVPSALAVLRPVLYESVGQGGYRIFHESFRRFMLDELNRQGRTLKVVLQPVIEWLESSGIFKSAKSYRFLFSALRRAGLHDQLLAHIGADFVAKSVEYAHPIEAVERNIALAAQVASEELYWPLMVKLSELRRAAFNYFESQESWIEFAETYLEIHGASALAERLIFDGRATQSKGDGLIACSLIDDAGGVAPWEEYLNLSSSLSTSRYSDDPEELQKLSEEERQASSVIHGLLRLGLSWRAIKWFYRNLRKEGRLSLTLIRSIATRLSKELSPKIVEQIAQRAVPRNGNAPRISKGTATQLHLGISDEMYERGDSAGASESANSALSMCSSPLLVAQCLDKGGAIELAQYFAEVPSQIDIAVDDRDYIDNPVNIHCWVASLRLLSSSPEWGEIKEQELRRVDGDGWYRCWLRFVIKLADVEASSRAGKPYDMKLALSELVKDASPFTGKPRACDLYQIHGLIEQTIAQSLKLINSSDGWSDALDVLTKVCQGTGSRFDREDGGPLSFWTLIRLLIPHVSNNETGGKQVSEAIEQHVEVAHSNGTYYSSHADYELMLARVRNRQGDIDGALACWQQASIYLTAYGFRKDVTLFEVIDSAHVLGDFSESYALAAMSHLQPYTEIVQRHTDGRSTNRLPNAWFSQLLKLKPALAIELLAKTILEDDSAIDNWSTLQAMGEVANKVSDLSSPILIDSLWATIPFNVEYDNEGEDKVKERLEPIKKMIGEERVLAYSSFNRVAAEACGDNTKNIDMCMHYVHGASIELGIPVPKTAKPQYSKERHSYTSHDIWQKKGQHLQVDGPTFPAGASYFQLLTSLRDLVSRDLTEQESRFECVGLPLSYYLGELIESGDENKARQLVIFLARSSKRWFSGRTHPLHMLAEMLENSGNLSLSVIAYALAYTSSRGGGGWYRFGDSKHSAALRRAIEINRELAHKTVAEEVAYRLKELDYGAGLTENLIERISEWGEPEIAKAAWDAAFEVISLRLPEPVPHVVGHWFSKLDIDDQEWSIDEAIVALILCRLREPRLNRKVAALSGFQKAVRFHPEAVAKPLAWWLSRDTSISSSLLVMNTLVEAEQTPFSITHQLKDLLLGYARSDSWMLRHIALLLLNRSGFDVPHYSNRHYADLHGVSPSVSNATMGMFLSIDEGRMLDRLVGLWPDLPKRLANRYDSLNVMRQGLSHREKIGETYRLAHGDDGRVFPPVPVLGWHHELFISILDDELNGISPYLWRQGEWDKDVDQYIAACVIPNIPLHVALHSSRTIRPESPKPNEVESGVREVQFLPNDDLQHPSWIRLASYEEQFIRHRVAGGKTVEKFTLYSGVISHSDGQRIPEDAKPFRDGDVFEWWGEEGDLHPFRGPIIGASIVRDWLGKRFVLTPPPELNQLIKTEKPLFGDALRWLDEGGDPVLVLRRWNVRDTEVYGDEALELQGMEIVARPDLLGCLDRISLGELKEMTVVSYKRQDLSRLM